jgi:hypothetical protein
MQQTAVIVSSPQDASAQIGELRAKVNDLKLRASDLQTRRDQLMQQIGRASVSERPGLERQQAAANHEYTATTLQIDATNQQLHELESARDMKQMLAMQDMPATVATTAPQDPFLGPKEIMTVASGMFMLALPLVLVLARRLWVRGAPRMSVDLESSPRLQRMEQAIESIALEVERIGEAQRFTTKLFAERQPDAAARMVAPPRREPGTITPH